MSIVTINDPAPEISTKDFQDKDFSLSGFKGKKNVILVLNRGFV